MNTRPCADLRDDLLAREARLRDELRAHRARLLEPAAATGTPSSPAAKARRPTPKTSSTSR
ncbi:hypothetical protein [Methylibium sp. T29]|uniref:hypothetical protein n=1 Tax=Methylibium sp. T29 TaxID=1430884 RepID=UPI0003F3D49D|nr:hypothetical protein [Methylibium sp. T29]EWS53819.1 hypothetical protein X551_03391 [Methylibium sp. T29]